MVRVKILRQPCRPKDNETLARKVSAMAVTMKHDLPVPWSPATTIRTPVLPPGLPVAEVAFSICKIILKTTL